MVGRLYRPMNIRVILLPGFAGLLAVTSACQTLQSGHTDSFISRPVGSTNSQLNAGEVFADLHMDDVTNGAVLAWKKDGEQVVVTGKLGEKHVAVIARRDWYIHGYPWRVRYLQAMNDQRVCVWHYAKGEYDHAPTREDIAALFRRVHAPEDIRGFLFEETVR